ncbi:hydrolase, NUDIX family protein [Salinibacter ruber DSM 13855]|uniref:Hydrolase, NUDIX family protein n=3 Tax=Salinibacter ruber TaxID=146919 RepID=Q2S1D2_SALRD|nr:hydrolase, NUDIX family protein [Salinibacter ruber DSM 13855]CBH25017.1 hydrolase, NUDIX family protein [Salinibacter ruber M8]
MPHLPPGSSLENDHTCTSIQTTRPAAAPESILSVPMATLACAPSVVQPPSAMPGSVVRVVDVYPYRESAVNPEFLLLRRAPGTEYAGQWRMVGGKIESGEAAWETAHREVTEETGHAPDRLWTLPSVNAFYEWQDDRVNLIPAFAAALPGDPVLDDEHDAFAWLPAEEAAGRLAWPEQQRLLRLADQTLRAGIPPQLVVRTPPE